MSKIKEGYKKTKIGVIPKDWEVVKLGDIFYEIRDKIGDKNIETYSISAGKGFISQKNKFGKDISGKQNKNYILLKKNQFSYNKGNSKQYRYGCIYPNTTDKNIAVPNVFISFDFKKNEMSTQYYAKLFENHFLDRGLRKIISSSARMDGLLNINKKYFFELPIIKPPLQEQKKIAQILSTWDRAIEKQEKLIEVKEKLKKGLMQRLLTGEVRFKEFGSGTLVSQNGGVKTPLPSGWKEVRLGEIFNERTQRYKKLDTKNILEYSELLSVGINSGVTKRSDIEAKDNSSSNKDNYKLVNQNDIVYNTMRMWQGALGVSNLKGIVSPAYTVVYLNKNYCIEFFGRLFKMHRIIFNFYRYSQGLTSDTWNLKYHNFSKIKVKIPIEIKEQQKIAKVLSIADKEIELLKKELKALKEQKKGLMQRLLSGEVRVK